MTNWIQVTANSNLIQTKTEKAVLIKLPKSKLMFWHPAKCVRTNGKNGYLFKNDKDLLKIFKNLAQNKKILNNANKFICQKHDIQKIAKKFQNFYYKIL